jgi:hypothetical protein
MFASKQEQTSGTHIAVPKMSALRTIQAYGHTWTVRLTSRPEFEARFRSPLNTVILTLGGSISVLLFVLLSFLISRRERAEKMARQMTEDIRANEEMLRQSEMRIHAIVDGADRDHFTDMRRYPALQSGPSAHYKRQRSDWACATMFLDTDEVLRWTREAAPKHAGRPAPG